MRFHRSGGDAELLADLLVRVAGGYELHDLSLAIRDRRVGLRQGFSHGALKKSNRAPGAVFTERRIRGRIFRLRLRQGRGAGRRVRDEARFVASSVRFAELLLVERADPAQELELVAEVRPHHLWAVGRDRERHVVVDERPERLA